MKNVFLTTVAFGFSAIAPLKGFCQENAIDASESHSSFTALVKDLGLDKNCKMDFSSEGNIAFAQPRFAYVNLTGIEDIPTNNYAQKKAWMEVYDCEGNYFKKPLILKGQGGYTLRFPKRNFSVLFCDSNWTEEETPDFLIGDWIRQDGFHFKAFYTDFLRGIGEIGYKLYLDMSADRKPFWERGGYINESKALCVPDAFPCAVYLNNRFLGIYAWQLKKHRRNMNMKKSEAKHIHLDGYVNDKYLFDGKVDWLWFEVRNPKGLFTHKGTPYNGNKPEELMDQEDAEYGNENDPPETAEGKIRTAMVKQAVLKLSRYKAELSQFEQQGEAVLKRELEKRFDVESLLDYAVFFRMLMNGDGTTKNWQWFTYDGVKWMVAPYDLDQTFGITLHGFHRPANHTLSTITTGPFPFINKYYASEERTRYCALRQRGILSEERIMGIVYDWYNRIGAKWYEAELQRWPESPCYCEAVCNEGWKVCNDWSLYATSPAYSKYQLYKPGDVCVLDGRLWEATMPVEGVFPYVRNSDIDSIERLSAWIGERLRVLDEYYGYSREETGVTESAAKNISLPRKNIFSPEGKKLSTLQKGINIVQYDDGSARLILHR